jgi:hypothetical protein
MEPTTEKLAKALEEAKAPPAMIQKAREGYYDDYKSPLGGPIGQLVMDARAAGLADIERRAKDGEFNGTKEEAEEWFQSSDGQATFREFASAMKPQGPNRAARRKKNGN